MCCRDIHTYSLFQTISCEFCVFFVDKMKLLQRIITLGMAFSSTLLYISIKLYNDISLESVTTPPCIPPKQEIRTTDDDVDDLQPEVVMYPRRQFGIGLYRDTIRVFICVRNKQKLLFFIDFYFFSCLKYPNFNAMFMVTMLEFVV